MTGNRPLLKACLNGGRAVGSIVGLPISPSEVAQDAKAAREGGEGAVHVHPRDADGREQLDAVTIGTTVAAIRSLVPNIPIGVSTGDWIEPAAQTWFYLVQSWEVLHAFTSVKVRTSTCMTSCT